MHSSPDLLERAVAIIRQAGYLTLATVNPAGAPWAAQLQYAWFASPLSLVVGSHVATRHSTDIAVTHQAAAAVSLLPGMPEGPDGLQVAGRCTALAGPALAERVAYFYRQMHPDPAKASELALRPEQLSGDAMLRLYELRMEEVWILDLDRWAHEQISDRVQLDPQAVSEALRRATSPEYAQR
ncbi:pyridoxamine 5'-phosphate oxidase family protein [Brevibacterium sp. XM4083]|uniref:pyridoxamine 5'-phosphate oxidase family protein n=1 Tax=Brevibacterium sp. XM4083 TaxID=2583238 RepID=UPI0014856C8A